MRIWSPAATCANAWLRAHRRSPRSTPDCGAAAASSLLWSAESSTPHPYATSRDATE
ncbi:hypothetical protein ACFPK5_38065 [Streptomyces beijiangensis]|uniref:hypothetical protein n=1 Tax=Streptomyces beijiangensis TaxID=163361 RepID=UPI0036069317